jgi:hypothetical protein
MDVRRIAAIACLVGFFATLWLQFAIGQQAIDGLGPTCAQTVEILVKGRTFQACRITAILYLVGVYGPLFFFAAGALFETNRPRK